MISSAEHWNREAANYQQVYSGGPNSYNEQLLSFLSKELGLAPGSRILDIGCGVGKYGVALAVLGYEVTLTDLSPRMIDFSRENARNAGVTLRAECADWEQVTGDESWLRDGFDGILSTMCPAIHDEATLAKVIRLCRQVCLFTNFLTFEHTTANQVCQALGLPEVQRFAHPEETCRQLFDLILQAGFQPHLRKVPYGWSDRRTPEEFAERLIRQYHLPISSELLNEASRSFTDTDGLITDQVHTTVAWIWFTTKEGTTL